MASSGGHWGKRTRGKLKGTRYFVGANVVQRIKKSVLPPPYKDKIAARTKAFGRDPRTVYEFKNKVVSLDDLIASNLDSGAINPDYSTELQPRDRARAASQQQIDSVARNLVPESLLLDFHQIDKGAPIAGADGQVESGNGRILALRRAREQYPEQWQAYQDALRANLDANGLDAADLNGIKDAVLIRERITDVDRAAFGREANESAPLRMSPLEVAQGDARRISDALILRLDVGDEQSIDVALRSTKNRSFVRDFLGTIPDTERAALVRGDGTLSQSGLWRAKAAIFSRTLPGDAGKRIAETFLESLDSNIKNIETGLTGALPALAQAQTLIASGARYAELNLIDDMSRAVDMLARLREQGTMTAAQYVEQSSLFDREISARQERLLVHLDSISRSSKKIREFFNRYAELVDTSPDPQQSGFFGAAQPDPDAFINALVGA